MAPADPDPRYVQLLEATRAAARSGYDAVQMRDIAAQTHMSLRTVYAYVSSKDHLIAEAHVNWIGRLRSSITEQPPPGETAADRVVAVLQRVCRGLETNRELSLSILRALAAPEPAVLESRRAVADTFAAIVDAAIGDEDVPQRDTVIRTIGYLINGVLIQWAADGIDLDGAADVLERGTRLLLEPRQA